MSIVWIGLILVVISSLLGMLQKKWTILTFIGLITGVSLIGYNFFNNQQQSQIAEETILSSDENSSVKQPQKKEDLVNPAAKQEDLAKNDELPANKENGSETFKEEAAEVAPAPDIPEHVIGGQEQPWVEELAKLVKKPNHFPLAQSGWAPEDAPNTGDKIYEYIDIKLGGRAFQTIFLSKNPDDPDTWMVHVEPGANGLPIQPEELGKVRILGEGGNFIVFLIESGPFAGDYLIWASGGHRGGGEAVRIYSPPFLDREHGLAAQIAEAAKKP